MSKKTNKPVRALFPSDIKNLSAEDIASSSILKELLRVEVPKAIMQAFKDKKLYAPIFEINASSHFIEIHKKDWLTVLETCVIFNVDIENYETCSEINNMIKEIREAVKSPKIKIKIDD